MKIGIIGLGYWGKIILQTLKKLGYKDISICEESSVEFGDIGSIYPLVRDYKKLNCDKVFISTPAGSHHTICKYFLELGTDVFCEKPLCLSTQECEDLYDSATSSYLFVDWLFTFNNELSHIKGLLESRTFGKLYSVSLKRLNYGPVRKDVSARWDLASHDVSILLWLFGITPQHIMWTDYKSGEGGKDDSVVGVFKFDDFVALVNASWHYPTKDRECVFAFEKGILKWDDSYNKLTFNDMVISVKKEGSPLENSIKAFFAFDCDQMLRQKELTLGVTRVLEQ